MLLEREEPLQTLAQLTCAAADSMMRWLDTSGRLLACAADA